MDEIIDVLDENGNMTNKTISKDLAHLNGTWHGAIHIVVISPDKTKILLQYRCHNKKLYPNTWDIAVGGHISTGEKPIKAAERELKEELGLNLEDYQINQLCIVKEMLTNNDIYSNEFVTTYIIYSDIDVNKLVLQEEEVSSVKWFTKQELNDLIQQKRVVPHLELFDKLNKILL